MSQSLSNNTVQSELDWNAKNDVVLTLNFENSDRAQKMIISVIEYRQRTTS